MTSEDPSSLTEQRRLLREQLEVQRLRLSYQLAVSDSANDAFPRSMTLRWLIQEPELVIRIVERVAGKRAAAVMPMLLVFARFLRSTAR